MGDMAEMVNDESCDPLMDLPLGYIPAHGPKQKPKKKGKTLMPEKNQTQETVLLIDLSSIAHPLWHVSQQEPDPDYTSQRIAAVVRELAADHPHAAICCDSPISFRKDIDPTYKANRPAQQAALYHQIDLAREALAAEGFPIWCVDEFEGDDVIATATKQLRETVTWDYDVLIASADKDLLALVSDRVEVHSTRTGNRIGPAEVREKLGIDPALVVDYLTLVGDASDNIRGAKGIGPKTAVELLDRFGTLDNAFLALDNGDTEFKPAQRASLEELRTRLESVRSLIIMRTDVPLDVNAVFKTRKPAVIGDFMKEGKQVEKDTTPPPPEPPTATEAEVMPGVDETQLVPIEWERGLEPRSMGDAVVLAQRMFESRLCGAYGTPQAVLGTILLGRELGTASDGLAPQRPHHRRQTQPQRGVDGCASPQVRDGRLFSGRGDYR